MSTLSIARLPLDRATALAERVAAELTGFCDRMEVAGSIRRRRETCGDIDLVCVPKVGGRAAMIERCQRAARLVKHGEQYAVFQLANGFQLDIWFAHGGGGDMFVPEPSNFGILLLARTGSAMHNVWLAQLAQTAGLHFNPHRGLLRRGALIASAEEAEIFKALGLRFIPPEARER